MSKANEFSDARTMRSFVADVDEGMLARVHQSVCLDLNAGTGGGVMKCTLASNIKT